MPFKHILLVEDDADDQFLFQEALKEIDSTAVCTIANNGKEALEQLRTINPDVIFADVNMPLVNGIELLTKVLRMLHHPPIVLMSTSPKEKDSALELGANYFFIKPVIYNMLCYQLESLLKGQLSKNIFGVRNWQFL